MAQQSTTKKHATFVSEPMGNKPATALPGIGPVLGARLLDQNAGRADNVFGTYLVQNKDEGSFVAGMKANIGANTGQATACYHGVNEWSNQNFK